MEVPTDTAVTNFSKAFSRINRPVLFAYEPALQPNADFLKANLGGKVRLERFDDDGHALFVDDPVKFNRWLRSLSRACQSRTCRPTATRCYRFYSLFRTCRVSIDSEYAPRI
jgi:hypothetical protein